MNPQTQPQPSAIQTNQASQQLEATGAVDLWGLGGLILGSIVGGWIGHGVVKDKTGTTAGVILGSGIGGALASFGATLYYAKQIATSMVGQ